MITHSYGTVVTGHAAQKGSLNTDDVIALGSPGMGRGVDEASDLHLDGVPQDQGGERVHATVADNDIINLTNPPGDSIHGTDPADPDFGGDPFPSNPGTEDWYGYSVEAHSQYWDRRTASLRNIGLVIADRPTQDVGQ